MSDRPQGTEDVRWLSPDELRAWVRLQAVVELLPGALDSQLRRDANLSHYEYLLLAMLSEAPGRTLRMSELASATNATLPRLSHVVTRLEARGYVARTPSPEDRRATLASLTAEGWAKVVASAPGHVGAVRGHVLDALTAEQVAQLSAITSAIVRTLDPTNRLHALADDDSRPTPPAAV
ncbi:MarR family winged helix-turn-helix transcriptional regulator [Cellulomonas sp. KRMCY2]|uniref:MarR family winged helix-turn-helix transcriptional regulator n=1 Tax=Cellulomonas sp. KRMCY2 TaxID=1304865 RepID=UPI00045EC027|nr:MarR family transcriptional regulator [Cellulomonas sp. KRMCY2]